MNTTQHTPTPWHVGHVGTTQAYVANYEKRNVIASGHVYITDAEFIVTACNAHDANVARIAELEAALREITTVIHPRGSHAEIMFNIARAALGEKP